MGGRWGREREREREWNFRRLDVRPLFSSPSSFYESAREKFQSSELQFRFPNSRVPPSPTPFLRPAPPRPVRPRRSGLIFHSWQSLNRQIDSSDIESRDRIIFEIGTNLAGRTHSSRARRLADETGGLKRFPIRLARIEFYRRST
jgi:hypothetical protein